MRDIVRIGRAHLATDGAAALSLRAVARDLGVVSSAVYRYVGSRDELLTLLVVDGYDELGDAVGRRAGRRGRAPTTRPVPGDRPGGAGVGAGRAGDVRPALRQPGARLPAPAEQTTGPGTRVIGRLVEVWEDAWVAGAVSADERPVDAAAAVRATWPGSVATWASPRPTSSIARGVLVWAALFGCVSFEVFGQYGPDTFTQPRDLFEHQLEVLAGTVGLG